MYKGVLRIYFNMVTGLRLHPNLLIHRTLSVHLASKPSYDIHIVCLRSIHVYQQHRLLKSGSGLDMIFYSVTSSPPALRAVHER